MIYGNKKQSIIHRLPTALKLGALFVLSIILFFITNPYFMAACTLSIIALYPIASFQPLKIVQVLQSIWWMIAIIAIFQIFTATYSDAFVLTLRLTALILLAALVTLTTTTAAMIETFEIVFYPLKIFGINPAHTSLIISLTIRFIPIFKRISKEVHDAQKVRGLEKNLLALIIPIAVRMLKMSDEISDAIEARGYNK